MEFSNDLVNGLFECSGALFILNHCRVVLKDKAVNGVSILSTFWFFLWGVWNMYYYPTLNQPLSFWGGTIMVICNFVYICLLFYYSRRSSTE